MASREMRPPRPLVAALALCSLMATVSATIPLSFCSDDNTATGPLNENAQFMSASRCHDNCLASDSQAAFAVVSDQDCWCTDYAPSNKLDASACQPHCPGWQDELCGGAGFYGYLALNNMPLGTIGPSSSNVDSPSSTPEPSPPPPTTETQLDTRTVVHTTTNLVVSTRTAQQTPDVSYIIVTQAGGVSTLFVTPTASATSAPPIMFQPSSQQDFPVPHSTGLSNGAVAGITVGAIAGAVLLGLFLFFCCWKKRRGDRDGEGGIKRNTSVLSKVGLLRSGSQNLNIGKQPARIQTSGLAFGAGSGHGPASAGTLASDSQMSESRRSRPLFVDQRLNPNALFAQSNTSRTSVGTLQDNQDYSRPLEVRNPDM